MHLLSARGLLAGGPRSDARQSFPSGPPWTRALICAGALLLAGCVTSSTNSPLPGPALDALAPQFLAPVAVSVEAPGAEPVVAVASDGTVFVQGIGGVRVGGTVATNVNKIWRSADGKAFEDVTPPGLGQERSNDGFVAVGHGDTVYVENTASLTFELYRSEDHGATWQLLPAPKFPAFMHRSWIVPRGDATLHVVMEALPPGFAPRLLPVPGGLPALPLPPNPNEGMWYARSDDRGMTWSPPLQVDPQANFAGQGILAVSADGQQLYDVRYEEPPTPDGPHYTNGTWYLLASEDGGASWQRRDMFPLTSEMASAVEPLAIDAQGTLYMGWSQLVGTTSLLHLAHSGDGGRSWSKPFVLDPGNHTQAMPFLTAKAPGELGVMWYQADVAGPASKVNASWFVHYASVAAADTERPLLHTTRVTPEPVHQGNVCARGPACGPGEDRRLLDYPWLAFGPQGEAHLVWASTMWDQPSAFMGYAREAP